MNAEERAIKAIAECVGRDGGKNVAIRVAEQILEAEQVAREKALAERIKDRENWINPDDAAALQQRGWDQGREKALEEIARYADAWSGPGAEDIARKARALKDKP